jgi:hypothetical protein
MRLQFQADSVAMTVKPPSSSGLNDALRRERRANKHLRALIDELSVQVTLNTRNLEVQFTRLAQLQAEIDLLRKPSNGRRDHVAMPRDERS